MKALNYSMAINFFAGKIHRSRTEVNGVKAAKIAGSTTARIEGNDVIIRLYDTDILTMTPTGFTINTGGFNTRTTRDRINSFSPVNVYTKNNIPYAHGKPFAKTITFNWNCQELSSDSPDLVATKKLHKEIDKLIEVFLNNPVEPSTGDCWVCAFGGPNKDCMLSHIEEKYAHGTLFLNAMRSAGYTDYYISLLFTGLKNNMRQDRNTVKRIMRRYIRGIVGTVIQPRATNPYVGINL